MLLCFRAPKEGGETRARIGGRDQWEEEETRVIDFGLRSTGSKGERSVSFALLRRRATKGLPPARFLIASPSPILALPFFTTSAPFFFAFLRIFLIFLGPAPAHDEASQPRRLFVIFFFGWWPGGAALFFFLAPFRSALCAPAALSATKNWGKRRKGREGEGASAGGGGRRVCVCG